MSPAAVPQPGSFGDRLLRLEKALATAGGRPGGLSPRDLVTPAAILLFLRWLEHYESEQAALAAFEGRGHVPALPAALRWEALKKSRGAVLARPLDEDLPCGAYASARGLAGEEAPRAVARLRMAPAHPYGLAIRLLPLAWPRLQALPEGVRDALVQLVDAVSFERLEDRQAGERLFATLMREGVGGRSAIDLPSAAAELMIELARPQPGERIYDPCFGTGALLVAAARRLRAEARRLPARPWVDLQRNSLFGVDPSPDRYFVGLMRVILAGIEHPGLELGDALHRPRIRSLSREGFDCILAIPPWRKLERGYSASGGFDVPTSSSEGLFLQHIAACLRPGGRAVVALPAGFLAGGGSEKRVRKMLLEQFRVEGVIGLPANVLKPYANTDAGLLLFSRDKPGESVRFLSVTALRGTGARPDSSAADTPQAVASEFLARSPSGPVWSLPVSVLARREWDLSVKRSGVEELNERLDQLVRADPQIRIRPLGALAELWSGIRYRREDTLEVEDLGEADMLAATLAQAKRNLPDELRAQLKSDGHIPMLLRTGDLRPLALARPRLALVNGSLWEKARARAVAAGDVLISAGGSVGLVAVIPEWAAGGLASSDLIVIRPDKAGATLLPGYLAGILASDRYQQWLAGHARGAVIQRLSLAALRELPIPVPHPAIQARISAAVQDRKADALDELLRLLSAQQNDAVTLWLEQTEPLLSGLADTSARPGGVGSLPDLQRGAADFLSLRDRLPPGEREGLPKWVHAAWAAAEKLRGIAELPQGSALLAVLGNARLDLAQAIADIAPDSPGAQRARRFCTRVMDVIDAQVESILSAVRIVPELVTRELTQGSLDEIEVILHNRSQTALLRFHAASPQCHGEAQAKSLEAGESVALSLVAEVTETDQFDFVIVWSAARLDGVRVQGVLPLSIRVVPVAFAVEETLDWVASARPTRPLSVASQSRSETAVRRLPSSAADEDDFGPNPYVTGTPVTRPDMFYGRSEILNSIKRHLGSSSHRNVILLEGNRRAGKSSILAQLELPEALPGWVVVRCDFQGAPGHGALAGIPTDQVYAHLAQQIAEAGLRHGFTFWPPGQPDYNPGKPYRLEFRRAFANEIRALPAFDAFKELLEAVVETIAPKRLLLMLDEFDRIQEGIDSGVTSPQVPQNIRFLLNNYPAVSAILTGSRRMTQMRKEYWSVLFGLGHRISVTAIDAASARRLVTEPVRGRLVYPAAVADRIIHLCACQPFLIQRLCSQVFDRCAQARQATVSLAILEDAAEELVNGMEHFEAFWDFAGSERARFILCVIHRLSREAEAVPITLPMLEDELQRHGVRFKRDELVGDELKRLIELELISMEKEGQYRLAVPLLALWISRNKDFEDQRERAARESRAGSLT